MDAPGFPDLVVGWAKLLKFVVEKHRREPGDRLFVKELEEPVGLRLRIGDKVLIPQPQADFPGALPRTF